MKSNPLPLRNVTITGGFWAKKQQVNRETTLQIEYKQCKETGRIDAWKLNWKQGDPNPPHIYWDSDVAKLVEAAGYSLAMYPDPELERLMDELIDDMEKAQQPDGYLNTHYIAVEPEKRWYNLRDCHELYCAGHLMEAAVAYYQGTGKRKMLDVLCRYADYIATVFGDGPDQLKGFPGHEEIELALVKLATAAGNPKYLQLAKFFIDQRGQQPHYYDIEKERRGDMTPFVHGKADFLPYAYNQSHLPVREQKTAEGHAVRACYLYAGMASVARETQDQSLIDACKTLWDNVTTKRMYITGGVGSSRFGERFTFDYDLPNEEAYAETCAAIALCFFANNMLQLDANSDYADVLERALYNGVISGIADNGKQFFYDNVLASYPPYYKFSNQKSPRRQDWFGCACCPPNIARLIASLNYYLYTQAENTLFIHHYTNSQAKATLDNGTIAIDQKTDYPWDGDVKLTITPEADAMDATIAFRIPGWCKKADVSINGKNIDIQPLVEKGYAYIKRTWNNGDTISILLHMPVERVYANPAVRHDAGKVALMRGPILFCFEECDNGENLADLRLPPVAPVTVENAPAQLGEVPAIRAFGLKRDTANWKGKLYDTTPQKYVAADLIAVPYFLWANREPGSMTIWILE